MSAQMLAAAGNLTGTFTHSFTLVYSFILIYYVRNRRTFYRILILSIRLHFKL